VAGTLYFTADDGTHGRELWRSDGTTSGTTLVRDVRFPGASPDGDDGSTPTSLTAVAGTLFLQADDGSGRRLWRSDGTSAGTLPLAGDNTEADEMVALSNTLYFTARPVDDDVTELWRAEVSGAGRIKVTHFE